MIVFLRYLVLFGIQLFVYKHHGFQAGFILNFAVIMYGFLTAIESYGRYE